MRSEKQIVIMGGNSTASGGSGAGGGAAPVNTVAPVISGNTQVGQTLTTTDGTWTGDATITFTYQWQRNGVNIASATNNTYVVVEADAGKTNAGVAQPITCVVTGTNASGNSTGTSNALNIDVYVVSTAHIEDATDVSAGSSYSGGVWNGVAIGVAAANRKIALISCARDGSAGASAISAQTVGGNSTSQTIRVVNGNNSAEIRIGDVTSGTTANLVTTVSAFPQLRLGVGVFAIYGAGSSTATDTDSSTADAGAVSLTVAAKGVAIAGSIGVGGTSCTWTGLTEGYDAVVETTIIHSGASLNSNAGGNISMNADWLAAPTQPLAVFSSWGP